MRELREKGLLTESSKTICYVLGSKVDPTETGDETKWDGRVTIRAITYSTFVKRAEKRMLGLRDKLREVPFLQEHGIDVDAYMQPQLPRQSSLNLRGSTA